MSDQTIRFENGETYERYMGKWSQLAGDKFLTWLAPLTGMRWLDVGCGNGAFTEKIVQQCAPAAVHGIDPSEGQLRFARTRPGTQAAQYDLGDAMALSFPDNSFDAAVMPLVIFFVPVPAKGVAEMARVVRPGGLVTAYAWDFPDGGFPYDALLSEMRAMGMGVPTPPSPDASRIDVMRDLWVNAGLSDVETTVITVQRTYVDFDDYWTTIRGAPSVGTKVDTMTPDVHADLKARMVAKLPASANGQITLSARAHAAKGRVQ